MAVLVEGISVIARVPAIEERYPGGWEAFRDNAPNQTLCADNSLVRVGFMSPADVESFVKELEAKGLVFLADGETQDVAVADQQRGFSVKCDWAECGHVDIGGNRIMACRAVGDDSGQLMTPDGWRYEGSLSQSFGFAPTEQTDRSLQFLRHENGRDVYLNTVTGKEVYVGRSKR